MSIYISQLPLLCSSTRIILRKNQILRPISASLLLTNQFSNNSKQTHLHRSSVSLFSKSIRTEFSRPLLFDFRSARAMASQSQTESVHNFIVKVGFFVSLCQLFGDDFLVSLVFDKKFHVGFCDVLCG